MPKAASDSCFIFDLDGTLVLNEYANYEAYSQAFKTLGMQLDKDEYSDFFGLSVKDMLVAYTKKHNLDYSYVLLERLKEEKSKEYSDRMHLISLNSSIVHLLKSLHGHYPTALATTARKQNAMKVLEHFNLDRYFDYKVFGEDVDQTKPSPECYIKIAAYFNVAPEACVIFEDSVTGIAAAEAFGAHIVRVVQ